MTQNIYDNPDFFAAYAQLPRSVGGLDAAPEWPSLRALLPDLAARRVLDLGCGYGWFCRWARQAGASQVLGLDVSQRMLDRARASTDDPAITYAQADLETVALPAAAFDLAFSSLTLHYLEPLDRLLHAVHQALVPGGALVVSVEHPIFTAPARSGWVTVEGIRSWPVNRYLEEGPRSTDWLAKGVVKQHRTVAGYVTLLLSAGFQLSHMVEWGPDAAQLAAHPEWVDERQRPMFLLLAAQR